jgi:hypothetical protein
MGDDDDHYVPLQRIFHKYETMKRTTPTKGMDESGQGLKRAVAKATARPLGIQPNINRHCRLLLQIGQLLGCSYNLLPLLGATAHKNDSIVPE